MSKVFDRAVLRRALAVLAGLLALQAPLPSFANDKASAKKPAASAAAIRKPVERAKRAGPASGKSMVAAGKEAKGTSAARASANRGKSKPAAVSASVAKPLPAARKGRVVKASYAPREVAPPRVSIGQAIGLHMVDDPLALRSSVALVIDQQTGETLFEKNPDAVLPIASITKVMTAMVVLDAGLSMDEMLEISEADRDTERHTGSRLAFGTKLSRGEMMQLALMSSENRAAHALGRHYPGGLSAFVAAMNAKAQAIGMTDSRFSDPTGLSSGNVSNARDLARLVRAAHGYPAIRDWSTATDLTVDTGYRQVTFRSTNRLVDDPNWQIGLQKTGYISEAGKCLVMQARVEGRPVILVLLDATAAQARFADAQRLRKWIEQQPREIRPVADTRS